MEDVGTQVIVVHAKPAPEETRTENNSRPVAINVADDKAHVLLVDGEGRWEFHYLAAALARDRGIEMQSVLFEQPRIGRIDEETLREIGHPAKSLPTDPDALAKYDCIILGDVTPEQLPAESRTRLEKFVGERGGTLIVVAGKRAMPTAFLSRTPADDPMRKLLPIETAIPLLAPSGFPVAPHSRGQAGHIPADGADGRGQREPLGEVATALLGGARQGEAGRERFGHCQGRG